jgi:hypothetical protein
MAALPVCSSVLWLCSTLNKWLPPPTIIPPWANIRKVKPSHPNCKVKPALLNCKVNPSHFLLKLMPLLPVPVSQLVQPVLPADRPIRFRAHPTPGSCIASTSTLPPSETILSLTTIKSVSLSNLGLN